MGITDYFKPVETLSAGDVREFLKKHGPEEYNLLDVRQPREYERSHIPGARLIPMAELPERLRELDPAKPTITYCAAGVRSRAAASVLRTEGFSDVRSMQGGMNAWEGLAAAGPPDAGMAVFSGKATVEELTAAAWALEEGSRRFYAAVAEKLEDADARKLFQDLVKAEDRHKASLKALYRDLAGEDLAPPQAGDVMEGGVPVSDALAWAGGREAAEVLDLALSLEMSSYDLYIKMGRIAPDGKPKEVFRHLVAEERQHLERMADLLDRRL